MTGPGAENRVRPGHCDWRRPRAPVRRRLRRVGAIRSLMPQLLGASSTALQCQPVPHPFSYVIPRAWSSYRLSLEPARHDTAVTSACLAAPFIACRMLLLFTFFSFTPWAMESLGSEWDVVSVGRFGARGGRYTSLCVFRRRKQGDDPRGMGGFAVCAMAWQRVNEQQRCMCRVKRRPLEMMVGNRRNMVQSDRIKNRLKQ
jgi:hypothetical protein